jgi:hypothetical protein
MRRLILKSYGRLYNSVLFVETVSHVKVMTLHQNVNGNVIVTGIKMDIELNLFSLNDPRRPSCTLFDIP